MKIYLMLFFLLASLQIFAQGKWKNNIVVGFNGLCLSFHNDTSLPQVRRLYDSTIYAPYLSSHSNVCDSATGEIKFICSGTQIHDSNGAIMENGDSLMFDKIGSNSASHLRIQNQLSLILPKGNDEYYVFISTVSDSIFDKWYDSAAGYYQRAPYDQIVYALVDMKANGGMGKVQKKRITLFNADNNSPVHLSWSQMQACRHANGKDWWLLKHSSDSGLVYRFLVTADSIYGPYQQFIPGLDFFGGAEYPQGQLCFSKDGKHAAAIAGRWYSLPHLKRPTIMVADFDRQTGLFSNVKTFSVPKLNTGFPSVDTVQPAYSFYGSDGYNGMGIAFSPDNRFVYFTTLTYVMQLEYGEQDSAKAMSKVFQYVLFTDSTETQPTYFYFSMFNSLYYGPDGRIYIGHHSASSRHMSYINTPNGKGDSCNFCWNCIASFDTLSNPTYSVLTSMANMPDYDLGPEQADELPIQQFLATQWKAYPVPVAADLNISFDIGTKIVPTQLKIMDVRGRVVHTTEIRAGLNHQKFNLSHLANGVYYIQLYGQQQKIIISR